MAKLQTDWLNVVREGQTIDGRKVSAEDIEQMATHYNRDIKEAVMNYDHHRPIWNLGAVIEVRKIVDGQDKLRLQARLEPNLDCYRLNKESQVLYFSVEIHRELEEFNNEAYLYGLALTDEPASLGTSKLELFSANEGFEYSDWEEFTLLDADAPQPAIEKAGFFSKLFNKPKGEEMTQEQLEKLGGVFTAALQPVQEAITKLTAQGDEGDQGGKDEGQTTEGKQGGDSETITALKGQVEEMATTIKNLTDQFSTPDGRQTEQSDTPDGEDGAPKLHF